MRDKIIKVIEKHGLWFFCLWCLFIVFALTSCSDIERHQERDKLIGAAWDKAEVLDVKYYKCKSSDRYLQTFEMDGYKFVIFNNGYGSAMQAIIPIDSTSKELDEYIRMLEEDNLLLGETLAEYESR